MKISKTNLAGVALMLVGGVLAILKSVNEDKLMEEKSEQKINERNNANLLTENTSEEESTETTEE